MNTIRRCSLGCLLVAALLVAAVSGCQTNTGGMTLPSPQYLDHPPQFIPSQPGFPYANEEASMEATRRRLAQAENQPTN